MNVDFEGTERESSLFMLAPVQRHLPEVEGTEMTLLQVGGKGELLVQRCVEKNIHRQQASYQEIGYMLSE